MSKPFSLSIEVDPQTGQLRSLADPETSIPLIACEPGVELRFNDVDLPTRLVGHNESTGEHIAQLSGTIESGYGAAASLSVRRVISRGGNHLRPGPANSVHIRYELTRVPNQPAESGIDYIWRRAIEAAVRLETLTVLGAPMRWFGPNTRMRALAIGGTGPREHVSLEDGPVAEIVPWLQTPFRSEFPGQLSANGALYYDPETQKWVWMLVRRPATTGRICFDEHHIAYRFGYHKALPVEDEVFTPAVSLFWGQGLDAADQMLARQFDQYQEPPDWAWHSVWFWLHPAWAVDVDFDGAAEAVKVLSGECGVNGFGLMVHDVPPSGNDIDPGSYAPCFTAGGEQPMRRLMQAIHDARAHSYAWFSRHGHRPDTLGYQDQWAVRGVDGRPVRLRTRPDAGVNLDIINPADPDFQDYIFRWIEYYVCSLGIDGLFWDSGYQPIPPDFGDKPYLRFPGETNARAMQFYQRVMRLGRTLSDDFFQWAEGISLDMPMNLFSVDARSHGEHSGNRFMQRLAHLGPRRLMWRSAWAHDLASGWVMLNPANDVGRSMADYKAFAADPMNRWICRTVRERGVRHATGLADGVSRLDEFVVVSPKAAPQTVTVPEAPADKLTHVISGKTITGKRQGDAVAFELTEEGGYGFD